MKRIVLVGGGHAHALVLERWAARPPRGASVTLVSSSRRHHYSGMVPGYLQGRYAEGELAIELPPLTARAGARFVEGTAHSIDFPAGRIDVDGTTVPFDLLSLDVGSSTAWHGVAGAREHALSVRPMGRAVALRARLDALVDTASGREIAIAIVGGGAAGVEVALALHRRAAAAGAVPRVTIVERASSLLPEYAPSAGRRARTILERRGVRAVTGRGVARVFQTAVVLDNGETVESGLAVWLAGAAGPPLLATAGLPLDPRGFVLVDETLRASGVPAFGAGDCVTLERHPATPKAGVYAVRQAPVLEHNLRVAVEGGSPRRYAPQPSFLALLNTADGRALLRYRGIVSHSRWAWRLKDGIDRRFIRRFRRGS